MKKVLQITILLNLILLLTMKKGESPMTQEDIIKEHQYAEFYEKLQSTASEIFQFEDRGEAMKTWMKH